MPPSYQQGTPPVNGSPAAGGAASPSGGAASPSRERAPAPPPSPDNIATAQQPIDPVTDLLGGGRIVAFRVELAHAVGSVMAGLLLSQFWYWTNTPTAQARDGWFFMRIADIADETGLTRPEQETARKRLRALGLLEEEKRGVPMKLWFRVDKPALVRLLREYVAAKHAGIQQDEHAGLSHDGNPASQHAGFQHVNVPEFRRIARGKAQSLDAGIPHDITEISSETSSIDFSETSSESAEGPPRINASPQGEGEGEPIRASAEAIPDDPLVFLWQEALAYLAERVNLPTLRTHFAPLVVESISDDADGDGSAVPVVTLIAPSAFTVAWLEKRHAPLIAEALSEAAGVPVTVRLTLAGKENAPHAA